MNLPLLTLIIAAGIAWTASISNADIISIDNEFGVGMGTVDTVNQLEYLDLSLTVNMSFVNVNRELEQGGKFHGWRRASRTEVMSLTISAGLDIPNEPGLFTLLTTPEFTQLVEFLGPTQTLDEPFTIRSLEAFTGTPQGRPAQWHVISMFVIADVTAQVNNIHSRSGSSFNDTVGHYLIRDNTIPAPSTAALLSMGLFALTRRHR